MKRLMLFLIIAVGYGLTVNPVAAFSVPTGNSSEIANSACKYANDIAGCANDSQQLESARAGKDAYIKTILDTFLYVAAAVSFFFVIISGIRYVTSTGDSRRIQAAKDTLLYAIIGLIVTSLAVPIVGFVVSKVG